MTRDEFISKYLEQPENILVFLYRNHETLKPSELVFDVLNDLEALYIEDDQKILDIKKYRDSVVGNHKKVTSGGVELYDFNLN
jgi:hypothetical protein